VAAWVAAGIPQEAQAEMLRIDLSTLKKHYRVELDHGAALANGWAVGGLMQRIFAGDTTAMIFWCKARLGWRDRPEYNAENPLVVKGDAPQVDPHALARELRSALMEMKTVESAVRSLPSP